MFSIAQKRQISDAVQKILRDTNHPELPKLPEEIHFHLHVNGAAAWSWADILNTSSVHSSIANPWNEKQGGENA